MVNNIIIRQCDLIRENEYYKWYDINHIQELKNFITLVFSKQTRIAHLIHQSGWTIPVDVDDNGVLKCEFINH